MVEVKNNRKQEWKQTIEEAAVRNEESSAESIKI